MHDPQDIIGYIDTRLCQFFQKYEKYWDESLEWWKEKTGKKLNSLSNLKKLHKQTLIILKEDIKTSSKRIQDLFDAYHNKWYNKEIEIFKARKNEGLLSYWYMHDAIILFLHIVRMIDNFNRYDIMFLYLNTDFEEKRYVCAICSMKKFAKTACIEYLYTDQPNINTWCWREHNLLTKKDWKNIPIKGYYFNPNSKHPFSKEDQVKLVNIDTLHKMRKKLDN
jgi:hypothetical protein